MEEATKINDKKSFLAQIITKCYINGLNKTEHLVAEIHIQHDQIKEYVIDINSKKLKQYKVIDIELNNTIQDKLKELERDNNCMGLFIRKETLNPIKKLAPQKIKNNQTFRKKIIFSENIYPLNLIDPCNNMGAVCRQASSIHAPQPISSKILSQKKKTE